MVSAWLTAQGGGQPGGPGWFRGYGHGGRDTGLWRRCWNNGGRCRCNRRRRLRNLHLHDPPPLQSPSNDSGGNGSSGSDSSSEQQNPSTEGSSPQGEAPGPVATPQNANTGPQLVGNVPEGNVTVLIVYNSANQQIWVGTETSIFHASVSSDAIQNGGWTLVENTVDEQFVGGNATFENGQLTQWNWTSGHILGTPALQQAAENAISTIAGQ